MKYDSKIAQIDALKQRLDQHRSLAPEILQQLKEYFRIGLTYTSNAVEGNTLTESETKVVIEDGITIAGKPVKDTLEALGHSDAYDEMLRIAQGREFLEADVLKLHQLFYHRIDDAHAGNYRTTGVIITGTDYLPPPANQVPQAMTKWIAGIPASYQKYHPVELAARVHLDFVMIHPFVDGNGRVARLLMNLVLLQTGYTIAIIPPIVRADYITALVDANKGNATPFLNFISTMSLETMKDYLRIVEGV